MSRKAPLLVVLFVLAVVSAVLAVIGSITTTGNAAQPLASSCHHHHGTCPTSPSTTPTTPPTSRPTSPSSTPPGSVPTSPASSTTGTGIGFNHCGTNPTYTIVGSASNPHNGVTLGGYYVDADTWNFANYPGSMETLYACNFDNWYALVNVNNNANDGAVKTYPNVHEDFGSSRAVSSFADITSVFAHTAPSTGAWDYAYDIWLNGLNYELMVWTQSRGQQAHVPGIPVVGTTTIDGRAYTIHHTGSYTAYDMPTTTTSGNLDLLNIIKDAQARGLVPANATLTQIDYGVEVCDTGSVSTRFEVNNFSITTR
jgi:hypothetical protein